MIDYHMHTSLCKHAEGELYEYVEAAIRMGMDEIAFTDHIPLPDQFDSAHRMLPAQLDPYVEMVSGLKTRYPEITVRCGIEADYYEGFESYTESLLNQYAFDVVIMSVHFLRHWSTDNWVFNYHFPNKPIRDVYTDYLQTVRRGIQTGLFDIVGHVDIVKSPGDSLLTLVPDEVCQTLETVRDAGMVLEINTSGFRKKVGESYPGPDWLSRIKSYSVPITLGSDAHAPGQVGLAFDIISDALAKNDIRFLTRFEQRKQTKYLLEKST
ncbi:MAG: histidinol-phosphatase HisJ [Calditrichales bacterium]|nr:MAG: histidinol-phosphatase HisJ [Calditrichales bacterium]